MSAAILDSTHRELDEKIHSLFFAAMKGDTKSFELLLHFATQATFLVKAFTLVNPTTASQVARHRKHWPTLINPSLKDDFYGKPALKDLELGADYNGAVDLRRTYLEENDSKTIALLLLQLSQLFRAFCETVALAAYRKTMTPEDSSNPQQRSKDNGIPSFAENRVLHEEGHRELFLFRASVERLAAFLAIPFETINFKTSILAHAGSLPPLTSSTKKKWVAFGREILLAMTNQEPEKNPVLRKIGLYRQYTYHWKEVVKRTAEKSRAEFEKIKKTARAKATEESNIRDGIFTRIGEALPAVMKKEVQAQAAVKTSPERRRPNKGES